MPRAWLVVPGRITTRTGGYIYDRRIAAGLAALGWTVAISEIDGAFPRPDAAALAGARAVLAALPDGAIVIIDGLAMSAMPDVVEAEASRLRLVALVHLPRSADPTVPPGERAAVAAAEARALHAAALVVVTGPGTPALLAGYELAAGRIAVVEPGTDVPASPPVPRPAGAGPVGVLSVATLNGGKGHDILLRGLAALPPGAWTLTCAGSLTRDPATAGRVARLAADLGIGDRVRFAGDLDEQALAAEYAAADLFALATLRETWGMAVAEALAHGLPVVSTRTGAIEALVGADAGLLVPPGDEAAFAGALARAITQPALRGTMAQAARRRGATLPSWADAAGAMRAALERLEHHG
ncbi:MAG: glycosyltransferase family 4 protein [Vicinamibacterales bacterium]